MSSSTPIKYCLYARKSSEAEERQALSIDSQIKEMRQIAERDNLDIVKIKMEAHSAKNSGQRSIFNEMASEIRTGKYNGILTWAPDRLSRNAGDLGLLVDLMDQGHLHGIRTYNQQFSNSPNEKFLLMILCSQAKLENDNRGINVKRGLRTRVEMGLWPSSTPTGYRSLHRTDRLCELEIDKDRAPIIKEMFEKIAYDGWSCHDVLRHLIKIDFRSPNNKQLHLSTVQNMMRRPFYYGRFEFPRKSGKWYQGTHEPIITKEVFDLVQGRLDQLNTKKRGRARIFAPFAFLKLMKCGTCGAGITAQEQHKHRKNGEIIAYRYYSCVKATASRLCSELYINEVDLIDQLATIIDRVDINLIGMREELEEAIHRSYRLQSFVTGQPFLERSPLQKDIDLRAYAKQILMDGTLEERRKVLYRLQSKILLRKKQIYLVTDLREAAEISVLENEPKIILLDLRSLKRKIVFDVMGTKTVRPGQTLHLPGGIRLVFQEQTVPQRGGKVTWSSFLVDGLTEGGIHVLVQHIAKAVSEDKGFFKDMRVNDHITQPQALQKALARELRN